MVERRRVQIDVSEGGMTRQSMRDECDINLIMRKYERTGAISHARAFGGSYGYATSFDFHEAMNLVIRGQDMFAELPAKLRRRFNHDPAEFLEFMQNPENLAEARDLGLVDPEAPQAPTGGGPGAEPPAPPDGGDGSTQ